MNPSDEDRLLQGVFSDERLEEIRARSLAAGESAVKSRRRRRIAISTTAASLAVVLATLALMRRPPTLPSSRPAVSPAASAPEVTYIDDQQLFALFPNRPAALIGAPGKQTLVFLDSVK